jgi:hypothetical protein
VAVRRGRTLLVEARAVTPLTSRRLEEQRRQLQDAARVYMERHPREREPLLVLACPGVLRQSNRAAVAQGNLEIWDGPVPADHGRAAGYHCRARRREG